MENPQGGFVSPISCTPSRRRARAYEEQCETSFGDYTLTDRVRQARREAGSDYNRSVKRHAAEILKEALALPAEARAALAGSLLDSLDTEVDEDAGASWAIEVNRRVAQLDSRAV
jgi:hypothetical protein